jgi:hypothetical protein
MGEALAAAEEEAEGRVEPQPEDEAPELEIEVEEEAVAPERDGDEPVEEEVVALEHNAGEPPAVSQDDLRAFLAGEGGQHPEMHPSDGAVAEKSLQNEGFEQEHPSRLVHPEMHSESHEPTVEGTGYDPASEQSEPPLRADHAPTMHDLRALLTDPEWRASIPAPPDLGPLIPYGERMIPAALIEMQRRGYIKGWS